MPFRDHDQTIAPDVTPGVRGPIVSPEHGVGVSTLQSPAVSAGRVRQARRWPWRRAWIRTNSASVTTKTLGRNATATPSSACNARCGRAWPARPAASRCTRSQGHTGGRALHRSASRRRKVPACHAPREPCRQRRGDAAYLSGDSPGLRAHYRLRLRRHHLAWPAGVSLGIWRRPDHAPAHQAAFVAVRPRAGRAGIDRLRVRTSAQRSESAATAEETRPINTSVTARCAYRPHYYVKRKVACRKCIETLDGGLKMTKESAGRSVQQQMSVSLSARGTRS